MAEKQVAIIKVQQDKQKGIFRLAVPLQEVAHVLSLRKSQGVRVILDEELRRIIYEPLD